MDLLRFYLRIVTVAFSHSLSIAQAFVFSLIILTGMVPQFAPEVSASGWQVAAIALASIVCARLVLAPYWIWREERDRANKLATAADVEYVRRQQKRQLQHFYTAGLKLKERTLPKNSATDADVDAWIKEVDEWLIHTASWLDSNLGEGARARFLDRTGMLKTTWTLAVNETHNRTYFALDKFCQNLRAIIETDAWL